jgi:hypothetical protein
MDARDAFLGWNDEEEYFTFLGGVWDIAKAKQLLKENPRPTTLLDVGSAYRMIARSETAGDGSKVMRIGVQIDWGKVEEARMDIPVIVGYWRNSCIVLDGWHRVAKAQSRNVMELPCVVLNADETWDCMVHELCN